MKKNTEKERLKYEAASELGLMDKLKKQGWGGLTSKETGSIGARVMGRNRKKDSADRVDPRG